jgi:hypothetical protein
LWWTEWQWDRFSPGSSISSVNIMPWLCISFVSWGMSNTPTGVRSSETWCNLIDMKNQGKCWYTDRKQRKTLIEDLHNLYSGASIIMVTK